MSRKIIAEQQNSFEFSYSLLTKFIEVCPENIWAEKFGGWPIWQHVYHTVWAFDFFINKKDATPAPALFEGSIGGLTTIPAETASKEAIIDFAAMMKERADAYFSALTDDQLPLKNEGLSARKGMDISHAHTVVMMSAHILYHLGSCDAALRQYGLKGVF